MKTNSKKRTIIIYIMWTLVFVGILSLFNYAQYQKYQRMYNEKLNAICQGLTNQYKNIKPSDIMKVINDDTTVEDNFFEKYGIDLDTETVIRENDALFKEFLVHQCIIVVIMLGIIGVTILCNSLRRDKEIHKILKYIEQVNNGDYSLIIDDNKEGELSILKNEVYKTTIMLKEAADNSLKDKLTIKNSLSDISHQLKTPITSLLINLENIEDCIEGDIGNDSDNDNNNKNGINLELLQRLTLNSKRDTNSISKLVKNILELSKFDSNTIEYIRKEVNVSEIISDAVGKVEALADLLGIELVVEKITDGKDSREHLYCDAYWQTEAVANLLKNGIEHAKSRVRITYECNKVYTKIEVENDGDTISEHDRNHIFERFYKGENATKDSLGIGLSMVKAIVEKDKGYVTVSCEDGITVFTVKYL